MMKVADDQNNTLNSTELVLFKDGDVSLEVPVIPEEDTVWLSQAQMVELYSRDVSVISRHIRNIFKEGELDKESNLHFLQIANADRPVAFYSLDVIISVGYRVKSHRGIAFRKWANRVLKQYILRGYAVNDNRMKQLGEVVRLMKRTQESLDSKQVLTVIENYSRALELLDDCTVLGSLRPEEFIRYLFDSMGYREYCLRRGKDQEQTQKILDRIAQNSAACRDMQALLQYAADPKDAPSRQDMPEPGEGKSGVWILTMHASKGLEFDSVYIPDLNEGIVPSRRSRTEAEIEEERRLLYVAMTRAKTRLELLYIRGTRENPRPPSRFLKIYGVKSFV